MYGLKQIKSEVVSNWFIRHIDEVEFIQRKNHEEVCGFLRQFVNPDNIEENFEIALKLWKLFIEDSLQNLYDTDSKSIKDLKKYMDRYAKFEGILYGVNPYYRDHIIHSIWVFLIGYYLLKRHGKFKMIRTNIPSENKEAAWCVIALSHDLGYPFSQLDKIDESIQNIGRNMKGVQINTMKLKYENRFNVNLEKVLIMLSSEYETESEEIFRKNSKNQLYFLKERKEVRRKYMTSFSKKNHGILSCMVLVNFIPSFFEYMPDIIGYKDVPFSEKLEYDKRASLLQAISMHTCEEIHIVGKNRFGIFLMLCDEIGEICRPTKWNRLREMVPNICKIYIGKFDRDKKEIVLWFHSDIKDHEIKRYYEDTKTKFERITKITDTTRSKTNYEMTFKNYDGDDIGWFEYDQDKDFKCFSKF